jgi:hypothetical protein
MGAPPRQIHGAPALVLDPWWKDVDLAVWWAFLHRAVPHLDGGMGASPVGGSMQQRAPSPVVDPCGRWRSGGLLPLFSPLFQ